MQQTYHVKILQSPWIAPTPNYDSSRSSRIEAIKIYRLIANCGLKEAKDTVDSLSDKIEFDVVRGLNVIDLDIDKYLYTYDRHTFIQVTKQNTGNYTFDLCVTHDYDNKNIVAITFCKYTTQNIITRTDEIRIKCPFENWKETVKAFLDTLDVLPPATAS